MNSSILKGAIDVASYQLPTRSSRKYRGKYPRRLNSFSHSSTTIGDQTIIVEQLGIARPVHLELNDGTRFIVEASSLLNWKIGAEFSLMHNEPVIELTQEAYDTLLAEMKAYRDLREKNSKRVKYCQEGGDDGYCYVVRVDGSIRWSGLTRREAHYYRAKEIHNLYSLRNS